MTSGAPVLAEQQLGLAVGELESVFRFFDATSAGVISIQTFISTIIGEPKLERANLIRDTFQRLAQKSGDDINVGSLSNAATSFRQYYVGKNSKYWSRYVDSDGTLTMEKFLMFYGGVSCAVVADDSFAYTIAADWSGIADPLKTTSPYQRVKKVRVTMTNGESFEETLVVDTAASSDPSQLRTIYLARGIAVKSIRYLI